ncbi:MAG: undecaprenyl/decaprenyl-phosphate alpha-N-acetylglucosaminyl 1-phosphate transferase [Gemmatimonadetes bacterium]|nr:undecaprenyl/decaprenyl-phosphate alpha-N-acetylglucosaminyl 1-phosphate transferase [Gemmatimonadota bacterium]
MGSYLVVFFTAAAIAALSMPLMMALASRVGTMDNTREPAVPRVGGWAIALGCTSSLVLVGLLFAPTGLTVLGSAEHLGPIALGAAAILLLGTVDDALPLSASIKLAVQILIGVGVYALGTRVGLLSFPFGTLTLGPVTGLALTVVWLVGVSNAFNLLDGADGVAAGAGFFSAAAVLVMSVALGHPAVGLVAAGLAGALLGFLPFNFPPARAFLGDSGSLLTGFLLAGLSVEGSMKAPTLAAIAVPLLAFALPVFDTTAAFFRRLLQGQSVFAGDQDHLHHRLAQAGLTPRQVAGVLYTASAAFALASMLFINPGARSYAVVLLVLGSAVWLVVRYLRLHELNELARLAQRGVLQTRAIAHNVRLRRAAEALERVESMQDLLAALAILLQGSEFDDVMLSVAPADERRGASSVWRLVEGHFVPGAAPRRHDEWEVVCPFDGDGWIGELHLRRRLARRSLLLDLNLLLEIVQPALVQAARRISVVAMPSH